MLSRRNAVTGVDIGLGHVALARLEDGLRLTHWGVEPVRDDAASALRRLLDRIDLRPRRLGRVATAVAGAHVHVRQVTLPRLSPEDMQRALPFEAKKHLPLDQAADPCLDYQVLGESGTDGRTQEVLLVAAAREDRDGVLRTLDRCGIVPEVVDAQPLALVNAVLEAHRQEMNGGPVLMLDLGTPRSVLAVVSSDGGLYARSLGFDAGSGAPGEGAEPAALVREVQETLRFLQARERMEVPERLFLAGQGAASPRLAEPLARALGMPVTRVDAVRHLRVRGELSDSDRAVLTTAVGLARRWEA